jgi:hypothetical protein
MTEASSDRRLSVREEIKIPIRVRIWTSVILKELGTALEVLLKMPDEWLDSGHVVRAVIDPTGQHGTIRAMIEDTF